MAAAEGLAAEPAATAALSRLKGEENGDASEGRQLTPSTGKPNIFTVPSGEREGKATSGAEMEANGEFRVRSERNRNNRCIWMFPKWKEQTCILSVFSMQTTCSGSKMTFLMLFGSS